MIVDKDNIDDKICMMKIFKESKKWEKRLVFLKKGIVN